MADPAAPVAAPAKLNLYLHVTGRRADGFHLLDSLIAFADVGDRVTAEPAPDDALDLHVTGPFAMGLMSETDNLVLRAARVLRDAAGITAGARLTLEKNLPVASGIGGGSADAAAALRALSRLWGVALPEDRMRALALTLGADVPVCWVGRAAFVGGIGEDIQTAPALPAVPLVLVNPLKPLPTPGVFKARTGPFQQAARFSETPADPGHLARLLAGRENGLTTAAIAQEPAVARVLAALDGTDGVLLARMSGSGATCFALYPSDGAAETAAEALRTQHEDWWVAAGRLADA